MRSIFGFINNRVEYVRIYRDERSIKYKSQEHEVYIFQPNGLRLRRKPLLRRLVRSNVLGFPVMFKDSRVWLQIMPENQMLGESRFPP